MKINCDSISAIYLANNQVYLARKMHIDVRFYFEIFKEGDLVLEKNSHVGESGRHAYQGDFGSLIQPLSELIPYPFSCLRLMELVWRNYVWLDPLGQGIRRQP